MTSRRPLTKNVYKWLVQSNLPSFIHKKPSCFPLIWIVPPGQAFNVVLYLVLYTVKWVSCSVAKSADSDYKDNLQEKCIICLSEFEDGLDVR